MNFKEEYQKKVEEINEIIGGYIPKVKGPQSKVLEAMEYSILAGGKRLRPMLMLESFRLLGGWGDAPHPFMAAIEMIHTYSLVHDDLPALDNDEYRRGKKSTHAKYGEAMGILCGDGLLNCAFEIISDALVDRPDAARAEAFNVLAKKVGIYGMIGGQVVDVENEGKPMDEQTLMFIYQNKTAALIEAALMVGAILARASMNEMKSMKSIGSDVGVAFQIQDDILDVTSTTEILGKPVGSDDKNNKVTYVSLFGLDRAREEVERLSQRAIQTLDSLGREDGFLKELISYLILRNH